MENHPWALFFHAATVRAGHSSVREDAQYADLMWEEYLFRFPDAKKRRDNPVIPKKPIADDVEREGK
jgi:hypothetical protein